MADSAVIVPIPQAAARFGDLRRRFDPSAALGVPPHVTVLVPFVPPQWIDAGVRRELAEVVQRVPPFEAVFARVGRWPQTAWLAPEPAAPFVALTRGLVERFPAFAPYGGRFAQVVPHLTLADGDAKAADAAQAAAEAILRAGGPLRVRCEGVELIENSSGIWRTMRVFALGRAYPGPDDHE